MSADREDGNYWMSIPASGKARPQVLTPVLDAMSVYGVEPLGAQLDVTQPLTVPLTLREELFSQADVIEGRDILPLHTYALLDAAKVPGLPEMLETSGLDHACLFQGTAAEELRDVAPWIVRLHEYHKFTRNVFTSGNAPWDMWDKEPGILLRSRGSLADLRKHLRKFTRVKDETGKWYYVRFYDPAVATRMLDQTVFWAALTAPLDRVVLLAGDQASVLRRAQGAAECSPPVLDFDLERRKELARRLSKNAAIAVAALTMSEDEKPNAQRIARDCMARMMSYGFVNEKHLRVMATWELVFGHRYEEYDPEGTLLKICQQKKPALRRFKAFTKRMDQVNFKRLRA
ncbi:MAG: DUF4123 domain-containing protein [Pseudomonadota bacterium]